jgi:hypothetical protein
MQDNCESHLTLDESQTIFTEMLPNPLYAIVSILYTASLYHRYVLYVHYGYTNQWWYSVRFVVITRQLQADKCSLSSQLFGPIFPLLEDLRFLYCCTQCK